MANQLIVKNGLIVSGSIRATGGVTGSLLGTASLATSASNALQATSASFATTAGSAATASYVLQAVSASFATSAATLGGNVASAIATTGSNTFAGSQVFNGNITVNGTGSFTYLNTIYESASVIYSSGSNQFGDASNDVQTLMGTIVMTGSLQVTGSANIPSITGSLSGNASTATNATNTTNIGVTDRNGNTGPFYVTFVSSTSGNNAIGVDSTSLQYNANTDTLTVANVAGTAETASYVAGANVDGAVGNSNALNGQGASYYTNASNINAGTISNTYLPSAINVTSVTASFRGNLTGTASYATQALTASFATTASFALRSVSASFASTASSVNTLNQNVLVNGNIEATGSVQGFTVKAVDELVVGAAFAKTRSEIVEASIGQTIPLLVVSSSLESTHAVFIKYALIDYTATQSPGPGQNMRAGNLVVITDIVDGGSNANITETTTQDIGDTSLVDFDAVVTGLNLAIRMRNQSSAVYNAYIEYTRF